MTTCPSDRWRAFLVPERLFLIIGLPLALAYMVLFSNLTNYNHGAERMLHVAHYAMVLRGQAGHIPAGFDELAAFAGRNKGKSKQQFPEEEDAKQVTPLNLLDIVGLKDNSRGGIVRGIALKRDDLREFEVQNKAAHYPFIGYLPFLPAAVVGIALDMRPITIMYLMILSHIAYALALGYFTIRYTPVLKWAFTFILLWPSLCVNRVSISPDATVVEICFLMAALAMHYRQQGLLLRRGQQALLAVVAGITGIIKAAYFLVPAITLLLPASCFNNRWGWLRCVLLCVGISVGLATAWNLYAAYTYYNFLNDFVGLSDNAWRYGPNTLNIIMSDPIGFYHDLFISLASHEFLNGAVANLVLWNGQVRNLHNWVYRSEYAPLLWGVVGIVAWLALLPADEPEERPLKPLQRALCFALFAATVVVIATLNYVAYYHNHRFYEPFIVNVRNSFYIQGRYFVPILPLILLACYRPTWLARLAKARCLAFAGLALAALALSYIHALMLGALL